MAAALLLPILVALMAFTGFSDAVDVLVKGVDKHRCPFEVQASYLPDASAVEITYDTKNTSLASYGPSIPAQENSKSCFISVSVELSQVQRISFEGLEMVAPAELDAGLEAVFKADLIWPIFTHQAFLTGSSLVGPTNSSSLTHKFFLADTPKYQSFCSSGGYQDGRQPFKIWLRSHFSVTTLSSIPSSSVGEFGRDAVVKQRVKLSYGEPCPDRKTAGKNYQICVIDRRDEYYCVCNAEQDGWQSGCESWVRFPPYPMSY